MYKVGFTGTRNIERVSNERFYRLIQSIHVLIEEYGGIEFHHGDCLGTDERVHSLLEGVKDVLIVIHPPTNPKLRAYCNALTYRPEVPYLERNRNIVQETDELFALPTDPDREEQRSGTWATIRSARYHGKPVTLY